MLLKGLVPITRTFKFTASSRHSFPQTRSKRWVEAVQNLSYVAVETYRKAFVEIASTDSRGKPKSGTLIFELHPDKLELYKPYEKMLRKGGFTAQLPIVNLNQAYVKSKFAVFVEPDQPNEIMPTFTVGYFEPRSSRPSISTSTVTTETVYEDSLSRQIRRMKICQELDQFIRM